MKTELEKYFNKLAKIIKESRDPYAHQYKDELMNAMKEVATQNWIDNGAPELTIEQVNEIYTSVLTENKKLYNFTAPVYKFVCMNGELEFNFIPN